VWDLLCSDKQILSLMGLADATPEEVKDRILRRSYWDDLTAREKRMCIYFRPSRTAINPETINEVIQVDVHVPADEDFTAYKIQKQVVQLLKDREINGKLLRFVGQLGELASAPSFICVGTRFTYNSTL